jgi:hypothetical protein
VTDPGETREERLAVEEGTPVVEEEVGVTEEPTVLTLLSPPSGPVLPLLQPKEEDRRSQV